MFRRKDRVKGARDEEMEDREKEEKFTRQEMEITYRILILAVMTRSARFERLDLVEARPRDRLS